MENIYGGLAILFLMAVVGGYIAYASDKTGADAITTRRNTKKRK